MSELSKSFRTGVLQRILIEGRAHRGWSLTEAAKKLGVAKGHMHDLEKGRSANPSLGLLWRIWEEYEACPVCTSSHVKVVVRK